MFSEKRSPKRLLPLYILTLLALIPQEKGVGFSYNDGALRAIGVEQGKLGNRL